MKIWHGLESYPTSAPPCSVAIGRFDGVHLGHQALIEAAVRDAREHGRPSVILTFDRHPAELFAPDRAPEYLTTIEQKSALIRALQPDHLLIVRFDSRFRDLSPEAFLHCVVSGVLRAEAVFVGADFRFGFEHAGDVEYLRSAQRRLGYRTEVLEPVMVGREKASSSRVRELLKEGEVRHAARMLGRPHALEGEVVLGEQLGRKLGYPTANLDTGSRQVIPKDGIYAVHVRVGGGHWKGACSIGVRPTVGGTTRTVETFILDFAGDLYGKAMTLDFIERLRDEEKFDSLDALVAQIAADVERVRSVEF